MNGYDIVTPIRAGAGMYQDAAQMVRAREQLNLQKEAQGRIASHQEAQMKIAQAEEERRAFEFATKSAFADSFTRHHAEALWQMGDTSDPNAEEEAFTRAYKLAVAEVPGYGADRAFNLIESSLNRRESQANAAAIARDKAATESANRLAFEGIKHNHALEVQQMKSDTALEIAAGKAETRAEVSGGGNKLEFERNRALIRSIANDSTLPSEEKLKRIAALDFTGKAAPEEKKEDDIAAAERMLSDLEANEEDDFNLVIDPNTKRPTVQADTWNKWGEPATVVRQKLNEMRRQRGQSMPSRSGITVLDFNDIIKTNRKTNAVSR